MISKIVGEVTALSEPCHISVFTHAGVGYEVRTICAVSGMVNLWIHTDVRENAIDLYGFVNKSELEMFRKLIKIQGLGPKTSLIIMGTHTISDILEAINTQNFSFFEKISGIGKKTAKNIIENFK